MIINNSIRNRLVWLLPVLVLGLTTHAFTREVAVTLPDAQVDASLLSAGHEANAVFAGGCFWGVEAVFRHTKGVKTAVSGYAGGTTVAPSYEQVGTGMTGHAETVSVQYDPSVVSYGQLLKIFMSVAHNPTELNRQGPDHGTQYRSVIFYTSSEQQKIAQAYLTQLKDARSFSAPIVTQLVALERFYPAEGYHQNYLALHPDNPYVAYNDIPKLEELKRLYPALYRP